MFEKITQIALQLLKDSSHDEENIRFAVNCALH